MRFLNIVSDKEVDSFMNLNHVKGFEEFDAKGADLASTGNHVLGKKLKPEKTYYGIRFQYEKASMRMVWEDSRNRLIALERIKKLVGPAPRIKCNGVVV